SASVSARRARVSASAAARTPSSSSPIVTTDTASSEGSSPSGRSVSWAMKIDVSARPRLTTRRSFRRRGDRSRDATPDLVWRRRAGPVRRGQEGPRPVRLIVARCEVVSTGRLAAFLPESTRLLMLKADGSVLVHADAGGYKPLNWMTPPTVIEDGGDVLVVRKRAGKTEDRLEIRLLEVLSDVEHDMGEAASLEKDGVERDLQLELASQP